MNDISGKLWKIRRDEAFAFLVLGAISVAIWGLSFLMTPTQL